MELYWIYMYTFPLTFFKVSNGETLTVTKQITTAQDVQQMPSSSMSETIKSLMSESRPPSSLSGGMPHSSMIPYSMSERLPQSSILESLISSPMPGSMSLQTMSGGTIALQSMFGSAPQTSMFESIPPLMSGSMPLSGSMPPSSVLGSVPPWTISESLLPPSVSGNMSQPSITGSTPPQTMSDSILPSAMSANMTAPQISGSLLAYSMSGSMAPPLLQSMSGGVPPPSMPGSMSGSMPPPIYESMQPPSMPGSSSPPLLQSGNISPSSMPGSMTPPSSILSTPTQSGNTQQSMSESMPSPPSGGMPSSPPMSGSITQPSSILSPPPQSGSTKQSMSESMPSPPSGSLPSPSTSVGMSPPPPLWGSMPPPSMFGSIAPSLSGGTPPPSMSGNTPPPPSAFGSMPPLSMFKSIPPPAVESMPPPPPPSGSTTPLSMLVSMQPPSMSGSMPPPSSISGNIPQASISGNMPPPLTGSMQTPSMFGSMAPSLSGGMPPTSMSGSMPPSPTVSGSMPPLSMFTSMPPPSMSESMPPPPHPPSGSIPQLSMQGSMQPPSMSENMLPPPSISGNMPPPSMSASIQLPSMFGSMAPSPSGGMPLTSISGSIPSPPPASGSMLPPSMFRSMPPTSTSESMPPPSGSIPPLSMLLSMQPPSMSGSMPPPSSISGNIPQASISGNIPQASMSGNMPPPSGSMPPPSMFGSMVPSPSGGMPPTSTPGSMQPPPSGSGSMQPVSMFRSMPPTSMSESMKPPPPPPSGSIPPLSMQGSIQPPSMSGNMLPPPSISGNMPPPSMSGNMLPPPSISENMPPPSMSGNMLPPPPSMSGNMLPPPSGSIQPLSMFGSMAPSPSGGMPPPSISGSIPPPPPASGSMLPPSMFRSMPPTSTSESMPPTPHPPSGSTTPLSMLVSMQPPSMSGSIPPPTSISGNMPPPSMSGNMSPPPSGSIQPPSMFGSMAPSPSGGMAPPSISESIPPPSPASGSMLPPSMFRSMPPTSMSKSMPLPPPTPSGSIPPPSVLGSMQPPLMSGSMQSAPTSISGTSGSAPPSRSISSSGSISITPPGSTPPSPPVPPSGNILPPSISGSMSPPASGSMPQPSISVTYMSGNLSTVSLPRQSLVQNMTSSMLSVESISHSTSGSISIASEYIRPSHTLNLVSSSAVSCLGEYDPCNGMCTTDPSYKNTTDCSGTCNGTAYIDSACSGLCVGGTTGVMTNISRDCNGMCNGTNVLDSCNVCGPPYNETVGSLYRGCDGICYSPANLNEKAVNNKCGQCTGGTTGRNATFGIDLCGVCGGNSSSCTDCEGVPNGGKTLDACGVCGGTGTTCLAVSSVMPDYIPALVQFSINVYGAGFNQANLECSMVNSNTSTETALTISNTIGFQNLTAIVPATLVVGEYTLFCRGSSTPESNVNITVYDGSSVTVTSITPTAFTKGQQTDTQQFTITGTEFVTNHTYCMITGPSLSIIVEATVTSSTSATCTINHPAKSMAMEISVSLNKVTKIGSSTIVKAQAAAPTAVVKFTDIGDAIAVKFNVAVDISNFSSCDDIFTNLTGAVCKASSPRLIFISIAGSTLSLGDTLIPKLDVIKQANELEAIPFNDSLTIQTADNPVQPVVNIIGPSEVGGCVSNIVLDAGSSTGLGLTYSWTVSPTSDLTGNNTSTVTIVNATANNYTFTLVVTNNLNQATTVNHVVEKKSVKAPELLVISTGGKTVRVSDSFDLVAKAKLIDGCVDVQLLYTWSFTGGVTANANRKNLARYLVDANTLPANRQITATVNIALSSAPQTSVISASVTFSTVYPALSAYIKGSTERHVGLDSGTFELDASISVDPSNVGNMQYEWNCVQPSTTSPCIFNGVSSITSRTAVFSMAANKLVAGNRYNFYVTISSDSRTDRADVVVVAVVGVPPKVEFRLLPNGGFTSVDKVVSLIAEIETSGNSIIQETNWESVQVDGYGYIDLSLAENRNYEPRYFALGGNKHLVAFSIKKYVLMKGQKYRVKVTITDNSNNQVPSIVDFQTYQGVSSCTLVPLSNYMIFSEVTFKASGCVTDSEGGTLTYKLLLDTDANGNEQRLSPNSVSNSITLPFAPKAHLGTKNKFTIEVCAQKGGCMRVRTGDVTVTANTATAAEVESNVLNEVGKLSKTSNPLEGTVVLSVYLKSKETQSRRKRDVTTNSVYTLMLDLVESVLNTTKTETSLATLLDTMSALKYTEVSNADLSKLVGYYNEILTFLKTNNIRVQKDAVKSMTEFAFDIKSRSILVSFEEDIRKTLSKAFKYGDGETYVIGNSHTMKMSEDFLGSSYQTGDSTNPIAVNFGSTLLDQYKSWTCSSGKCAGVFITSKHYETAQDPYSTTSSDQTMRVSDVLDLTIEDPSSGTSLSTVSNLANPISFTFPITRTQPGKTYLCKYWDPSSSAWMTSGMTTTAQNATSATCTSNHLTSFAIFYVNGSNNSATSSNITWALVGGILAALSFIIIAVVLFMSLVVMKQKKNKVLSIVVEPTQNVNEYKVSV